MTTQDIPAQVQTFNLVNIQVMMLLSNKVMMLSSQAIASIKAMNHLKAAPDTGKAKEPVPRSTVPMTDKPKTKIPKHMTVGTVSRK